MVLDYFAQKLRTPSCKAYLTLLIKIIDKLNYSQLTNGLILHYFNNIDIALFRNFLA